MEIFDFVGKYNRMCSFYDKDGDCSSCPIYTKYRSSFESGFSCPQIVFYNLFDCVAQVRTWAEEYPDSKTKVMQQQIVELNAEIDKLQSELKDAIADINESSKHVKIQYDYHEYTISEFCDAMTELKQTVNEYKQEIYEIKKKLKECLSI